MKNCEIAVTGLGLITPLGCGVEWNWDRIRRGDSVTAEPSAIFSGGLSSDLPEELAAYVRTSPFVNPNGHHRIFPMAFAAAREALAMSGFSGNALADAVRAGLRVGCTVSISKPIVAFSRRNESVDFIEQYLPDAVGRYILREMGISGPCVNVIAACATGVHSLQAGARWLEEDSCDIVICGSAESSLHPLIVSGFKQMGVLSQNPRPFDRARDGFMMGEGAGVLVIERKDRALARFAANASTRPDRPAILAELEGSAVGTDVSHPTLFDRTGDSIVAVLNRALRDANAAPADISYLNAHGTGTLMNDAIESAAIRKVFGPNSNHNSSKGSHPLLVSSTKGSTGHLLGASGSVEAAIACLALRDQCAPPSAALENIDESQCDGIHFVTGKARSQELGRAASLSFGFGGPIGAVIFKRPEN